MYDIQSRSFAYDVHFVVGQLEAEKKGGGCCKFSYVIDCSPSFEYAVDTLTDCIPVFWKFVFSHTLQSDI